MKKEQPVSRRKRTLARFRRRSELLSMALPPLAATLSCHYEQDVCIGVLYLIRQLMRVTRLQEDLNAEWKESVAVFKEQWVVTTRHTKPALPLRVAWVAVGNPCGMRCEYALLRS